MDIKELHEVLHEIVRKYGTNILNETRLKGILPDLMPYAERKYLKVFKQAVNEGVGLKLLEMANEDKSLRNIKINTLKESFRSNNGLNETADYVFDCFLFALDWIEIPKPDQHFPTKTDAINIIETEWADSQISWIDSSKVNTILDASNLLHNNQAKYGYLLMDTYSTTFTKHLYLDFGMERIIDGLMFCYEFPNCLQGKASNYPGNIAYTCKVNLYYKNDINEWISAHNSPNINTLKADQGSVISDIYSAIFPKITVKEIKIEMIGNYWLGGSYQTTNYFRINGFKFRINSNSPENEIKNEINYKCNSCGIVNLSAKLVPHYCPNCKKSNGYWTDLKSMQIMKSDFRVSAFDRRVDDFLYKHNSEKWKKIN